jgi:peptidoglycan/LPS O-acetylase OafA/YrhL
MQASPTQADAAGHVPVLDGIRGLAIAMVLVYHCTNFTARTAADWGLLGLVSFGWAGVDLFFVLSGYLITGILLDQKGSPHFLRNFYARRVLRIFPLYYAVLAGALYVLPHVLPTEKLGRSAGVAADAVWYWTYLSNFAIARAHGFRSAVIDISWSLAIEEQFYLLWPATVLFCSRRTLLRVAVAAGLFSLGLRLVLRLGLGVGAHEVYVLTPTRLDGLAVGAAAAILARGPGGVGALRPAARRIAALAGPLALGLLVHEFYVQRDMLTPGEVRPLGTVGLSLLALSFGAMLVLAVTAPPASALGRFFASGLLRTFGKYSYAMYLFHLPVRAVIRDRLYGPAWSAARVKFPMIAGSELVGQLLFYAIAAAATLGLAWLSFHLFEKRFLDLKRYFVAGPAEGRPGSAAQAS